MDMEQKDADSLKCNTLRVLINYPDGIKFGDFIGAYYQIHHFHPQLSHYGYSSLRHLLDDMRETVVVKGSQSSEPVMKLIDGLNLDGWLDEIENDGLYNFEEEDSRLKVEERTRGDDPAADLAEVLAAVTNLLIEYQSGLKFDKMKTLLFSTIGIDLQTFSIAKGYKDAITFLGDQIPNLIIRRRGNTCVVQLSKDLTVASVPICSILKLYPDGLKLSKLKEAVKKKCGYDLDVFCYQIGYSDIVSCLQDIPELVVNRNKNRNCRVRLKSAPFGCSSYGSSSSYSDSDQPTCTSNSSNQDGSEKKALLSKVMASLIALLSRYISGLRVKKLKELLLTEEGIDLEKVSFALGHKSIVKFLEQKIPPLILNYKKKRLYSVAIQPLSVPLLKSKGTTDPPNSAPDVPIPFLKSVETADPLNSATVPFRWSSCLPSSSSSDSDQSSNNSNPDESDKRPVLSDVMALVTALLSNYKNGLRIKKLQDFLLTDEGIDLEKFSIAQGYKDTVEFLEQKMPQLILNYQVNRHNTLVIESHSASEGHAQQMQGSTSAVSALSASDSHCQNIPASIAVVPPEVNNVFHTIQTCPSTMSSNLPSFHESHNTVSVNAKSSSLFSSVVRSQQPNPQQPSAKSVTEQIPSTSHMTTFQPSTVHDELKQQVARVLARHPKGLSLFQFRIAYSAAFKQHFPVGNAASTKERLLEMPDVVCVKGHGVQTLLFPVSPDVSPAKPGQPASSKVENVAVASNLVLVHPIPVTKPAVKALDSNSIGTPHLGSPEKPGSKDCCISKDQHRSMLLAQCQEQEKTRTNLPGFSGQLSKVEDIPVLPGYFLQDESLIVPQSFLVPAAPRATMMPIPRPHTSFLQYYEPITALENKRNKPFTEFHAQSTPSSTKIMQMNTHLNGPDPNLRETSFIPHYPAALPIYSQGTVCGDNLQPGNSRFTSSTNSKSSVPSVDSTPAPPVLVKPEICSPKSTSQSSNIIQPKLPVQPPSPTLSIEQRNYNHAITEFDSLSEAQIQSRAAQHFSSPDSSAKSSIPSLPRNSDSFFPPRSQLDHQLQQPTHVRLDELQSVSVSSADKTKASSDRVSPAAVYQRKPTYANSLETNSTTESFIACSVSGSLQTSSVVATNSSTSSSVSPRTRAASPASQLDFTANTYDQIAYTSAKITRRSSSPLFSETQVSSQQRQYVKAAATVISNTETTSPTSLSPESTTSSHHQFAYASSRITTNSTALSSETYAFTQTSETIIALSSKMVSSISSLDSTTSLPCQHACASAKATSTSSVLSKSTACQTPDVDFNASLTNDPPSQNNLTSSSSKQENQSSSQQKKQVPDNPNPKTYGRCLIL